jgi:asparagine synthase (glutamine-hydrolysing)
MSGIAGIFHCGTIKPVDPARVETMVGALAHRGPDGSSVWIAQGAGLGHCRFAALDPDQGIQPLLSADQRHVISLDGAIYNSRELRRELAGLGTEFRSKDDSEVVLAAYQRWGAECLSYLNGAFAMAIYDSSERTLFLARDRFGVKPLFTALLSDGSLAFASELKGLLAHPLLRREVDPRAIDDFMAWGYVPDHRCILRGVERLPAGHFRLLRHDAEAARPQQYWDISFAERRKGKVKDLEAELLHHLRQAVTSRIVPEVPLGILAYDNVESASVVAMMAEASRDPVRTFAMGLDGEAQRDSRVTQLVQLFGTRHSVRQCSADQPDLLDAIVTMFDEPFADVSALSTWQLCQLARESVPLALAGDGANEVMAGHRWQGFVRRVEQVRQIMPSSLRSRISAFSGDTAGIYARASGAVSPDLRHSIYGKNLSGQLGDYQAEQAVEAMLAKAPVRSGLDMAQYADCRMRLPGKVLTRLDRTSMATGLDLRVPLLDHRLVEFAAALPESLRVRRGQGKYLLRKAMGRYLPDELLSSRKQKQLSPLITQWLCGPLQARLRALSTRSTLVGAGWFDKAQLSRMAEAQIAGRSDNSVLFWRLIMLEKSLAQIGAGV